MPGFAVESYKVTTCVERFGDDGATMSRLLDLAGPVLEGDIQHRAIITFSDLPSPVGSSAVGYLSVAETGGRTIVGWLPVAELDEVLSHLDSGEVELRYRLVFGSVTSGYLDRLRVEPARAAADESPDQFATRRPQGSRVIDLGARLRRGGRRRVSAGSRQRRSGPVESAACS